MIYSLLFLIPKLSKNYPEKEAKIADKNLCVNFL